MKGSRILGVILFLVVMVILVNYSNGIDQNQKNNYLKVLSDAAVLSDSVVEFNDFTFNEDNKKNANIIEYTNKNNYSVDISSNNIVKTCVGSGISKENDEYLVQNNLKVNAMFSTTENGVKLPSLSINKGEKVYIHVITNYEGDEYPLNEVECSYSVNIETM